MKTINATGKSRPDPVALTKAQVDRGENELDILLDDPVSATSVRRFLESRNYSVRLEDDDGALMISARKKSPAPPQTPPAPQRGQAPRVPVPQEPAPQEQALTGQVPAGQVPERLAPAGKRTFSVLVTCRDLGQGELGETLMKSFLGALSQMEAPVAVALMNEGVKLALYDSSSCDHLKNLEKKGVPILVSGVCVHHFQIIDRIGVGTVSNMLEMLETLNKADKMMTL